MLAQVDKWYAHAFGRDLCDLEGSQRTHFDENLAHQPTAGPLTLERQCDLLVGDESARDHHLADVWQRLSLRGGPRLTSKHVIKPEFREHHDLTTASFEIGRTTTR